MYVNWQFCTVIGMVAGAQMQGMADWGLEFAMVVTFIGIVVPLLRTCPMLLCALVAGIAALLLRDLPHQIGLMLGSLLGIGVAMIVSPKPSDPAYESAYESAANTEQESAT